jgi:hypothetical protein
VDLLLDTRVSKEHTVSIFSPEDEISVMYSLSFFSPKMEKYVSPKLWYLPINPHGITTQKTNTEGSGNFCVATWTTRCGTFMMGSSHKSLCPAKYTRFLVCRGRNVTAKI